MRRIATCAALVVTVLAGAAVAFGAIPAGDGKIYAHHSNGDGSVRVQADPAKPCAKGWTALNWTAGHPHVPVTTTYLRRRTITVEAGINAVQADAQCDEGDVATGGSATQTAAWSRSRWTGPA